MPLLRPIITREHGAWALLLVPPVTGMLRSHPAWDHAWLIVAELSWFLCYVPVQSLLRAHAGKALSPDKRRASIFWALTYGAAACASSIILLLRTPAIVSAAGAAAALLFALNWMMSARTGRSLTSDVVAMLGMSMGTPAAFLASAGTLDHTAIAVWTLNVLFFGGSVVYVHMKIDAAAFKGNAISLRDRLTCGRWTMLVVVVMVLAALRIDLAPDRPFAAVVVLAPMIVYMIAGMVLLRARTNYKQVGLILTAQAVAFTVMIACA